MGPVYGNIEIKHSLLEHSTYEYHHDLNSCGLQYSGFVTGCPKMGNQEKMNHEEYLCIVITLVPSSIICTQGLTIEGLIGPLPLKLMSLVNLL